jgi:hypothetical protein
LTPINFVLNLWAHRNSVIHSGDPWCQPGSAFGLFAFRPGSHSASEDDVAAMRLDRDTVSIDQRAAPECFLDLLLDFHRLRFEPRLEAD